MKNSAVVIVNYNDSERVVNLAKKLKSYNFLKKIIISDNNSNSKKDIELLKSIENDKVIEILYNGDNLWFSGANNAALHHLKKYNIDYVFTINSDIDVEKETMIKSIEFLENNKNISLVSAQMYEYGEEKQCYYNFPSISKCAMENLGFVKLFKISPKIVKDYKNYYTCDYIRSSYWCVKYSDFEKIDFFDLNTKLYHVETCVGIKLNRLGKKCAIIKNLRYNHNHIYKTGYKIAGYKDSYNSLKYIFKKYYNKNVIQLSMLAVSYKFGLFLRWMFKIK